MTESDRLQLLEATVLVNRALLWENNTKIVLNTSVTKLANIYLFWGHSSAFTEVIHWQNANIPASSWKWQRDSEKSWRRCSLPSAPGATWHWWAEGAGTPSAAPSCEGSTRKHLQHEGDRRKAQLLNTGEKKCPILLESPHGPGED